MIGTGALVARQVRAHFTDRGRVLPAYAYVELQWTPEQPLEVRLSGCGQVTGEAVFGRDLLADALQSGAAGGPPGRVQFHLALPAPYYVPKLLVTVDPDHPGACMYALTPQPVGLFLAQTFDLVPAGQEHGYLPVDDAIAAILRAA